MLDQYFQFHLIWMMHKLRDIVFKSSLIDFVLGDGKTEEARSIVAKGAIIK